MAKPGKGIDQSELHRWFIYEPDTGLFRWREKPQRFAGKRDDIAGSMADQHGKKRRILWLQRRRMYASRAAYVYVHGDIPQGVLIDHIDGDTTNDRIDNLRIATAFQNSRNRLGKDGKFKRGVWKNSRGRYMTRFHVPELGRQVHLGTWDTEEEAHACFMGASAILHEEFWIGLRERYGLPQKAP